MKLLHTSDWHLGITFSGRSSLEDQNHFIDAICGIIREKSVGAVLLAGDVFDRSVAGGETVSFYDRIMTKIAGEMGISRQAVHEAISRASSRMAEMESSLGLAARYRQMENGLEQLRLMIQHHDYDQAEKMIDSLLAWDQEDQNGL